MDVKYYYNRSGRCPVEEFIKELDPDTQAQFVDAAYQLEMGKWLPFPLSRPLSSIHPGLHELRLRDRAGQIRRLFICSML